MSFRSRLAPTLNRGNVLDPSQIANLATLSNLYTSRGAVSDEDNREETIYTVESFESTEASGECALSNLTLAGDLCVCLCVCVCLCFGLCVLSVDT